MMAMTEEDGDGNSIAPDPSLIEAFSKLLFGYCDGWVAVREFAEKGTATRPPSLPFLRADSDLGTKLVAEATAAAKAGLALFVVPGTVSGRGKAKADDVVAMQTVLVDLDHGDVQAIHDHLAQHLGPPSLEVVSGGITEQGQEKLHLYWKLTEPAVGTDIPAVCKLRSAIAAKVGGDPSFGSAHQPIRVPGSIYRKGGVERLVTIRAERSLEYDLTDLAERVEALPALVESTVPTQHLIGATKEPAAKLFAKRVREGGADGITRFDALSRIIGYWIRRYGDGYVSREQAWEEIASYNEACIVPPWPIDRLRQETNRLWQRDSERKAKAGLGAAEFTEDALALQFTQRHGEDWRYVAGWGQWLVWTGTHWQRENTLQVYDLARIVCREAAAACDIVKLRAKLASAGTVAAVERLARADRRHAATTDVWDADLWSLNTPGGVVDLRSGILVPHRRTDANTKIATATPRGECPAWQDFLGTVTGGDAELEAYLQRVVGYCLTGITSEHALFFLYGTGANGKTVFLTTVSGILGDYATVAPMDMFMAATGERHPTDMAGLRGARLVTATETEQGRRWAESKLKTLTGGDKITARFMRQDFFEFIPQFKLIVAGNHKPAIRNVDEAMRRRLHLIPFTVTIPPAQRDQRLPEKLMAERDGIMAWAADGCREWQRVGLRAPRAVSAATEDISRLKTPLVGGSTKSASVGRTSPKPVQPSLPPGKCGRKPTVSSWHRSNGSSRALRVWGFEQRRDKRARGFRGLRLREGSAGTTEMGL